MWENTLVLWWHAGELDGNWLSVQKSDSMPVYHRKREEKMWQNLNQVVHLDKSFWEMTQKQETKHTEPASSQEVMAHSGVSVTMTKVWR